jgi:phosphoribulokinase
MEERGHSLESMLASIEARKPDFAAYVAPQGQYADLVVEVLPTLNLRKMTRRLFV